MENPEQDIKWECLDCGKVWYDDCYIVHLYCVGEECGSINIKGD